MITHGLSCDCVGFGHFGGGQMTPLTPLGYGPVINGMSDIFQQGFKQVLHKHCNFIASSLEEVGCGSNEPVYSGLNEPVVHFAPHWFILPVMIKSAQNLHLHDKTLSPECVMPFPRAPPRKTRPANNKRRKCAILTGSPERAAIEQHTMKQKKRGRPKAKQPIKQAKMDQVLETTKKESKRIRKWICHL